LASIAAFFYVRDSRRIDRRLAEGAFGDSLNVYAAPLTFTVGDGLSVDDITNELRDAGFQSSGSRQPSTWQQTGSGIEINPSAGSEQSPVTIGVTHGQIASIRAHGKPIREFTIPAPLISTVTSGNREQRQMVTFAEIPPILVQALVSVEDKHFFHHRGLDLPRIAKAAWVDIRRHRKEEGASTLTMQLVRGLWLEPDKKWRRKLAEALMTIHLENRWSKEKIFETYANEVYLGREAPWSVHGFAEGAHLFFGKDLHDLTLPETALLAGLVQRPSYYNPVRSPERARRRRNVVLALMRDNRYITPEQYAEAAATPIQVVEGEKEASAAPWFLDLVNEELRNRGDEEQNAKDIKTTLDLNLQRAADEAVAAGMAEVDRQLARRYAKGGPKAQAALIALDPHTGEIKAVVGGRDYNRSQLNRIFAKRPPGSVFKPFVYAAALNTALTGADRVYTPATTVDDAPTTFYFDGLSYQPSNFKHETYGTMTLRQALARSDNIAAVKVAEGVGLNAVVAMARRAGLNGDIKPTPAVALGAYSVTPMEIAAAYTIFANAGVWVKPTLISAMNDRSGTSLGADVAGAHQAINPALAWLMVNMLEEVMRSGTAAGVRARGFTLPAAGKTGTSHDGWFAGFTSQLLCIVWVGFDDYSQLGLEGAKSALPIWTEFMKRATRVAAYRSAHEFPMPSGIEKADICQDDGKLAGDGCANVRSEYFIEGSVPQQTSSPQAPNVTVTSFDPPERVGSSETVRLTPASPAGPSAPIETQSAPEPPPHPEKSDSKPAEPPSGNTPPQ
jgi:penicillin-binding protein 1B